MYPGEPAEIQISGEKGSARLRGGFLTAWQFDTEEPADAQRRIEFGPPADDKGKGGASDPKAISFTGHQRQFENFVRALDGTEKVLVDGTDTAVQGAATLKIGAGTTVASRIALSMVPPHASVAVPVPTCSVAA